MTTRNEPSRIRRRLDSGVGGLSVWREIVRELPSEDIVYLADQAHVPYGARSLDEVRALSEGIARFLIEQGAKIIVIACNTACAAALHYLRNRFPYIHFVGMEPAVKPAVEHTRTGIVAVIATRTTFQGRLFASLLQRYARDVKVLTKVGTGLVEAVERGELDTPGTEALLRRHIEPLLDAGADQLVLGCTHYPFLRPVIERIVDSRMAMIDPAPAVARQAAHVLAHLGLEASPNRAGRYTFYTSGDPAALARTLRRLLATAGGEPHVVRAVHWREGHLEALP